MTTNHLANTHRAANKEKCDSPHQRHLTNEGLQNDPKHPLELEDRGRISQDDVMETQTAR